MIGVIGAGPAGSYAAYLLAKKGHEVNIFEKGEVGKPVQCTGIVTNSIKDIVKIKKDFLINKIDSARIFSPNKKYIDVKMKNPNLIFDREKFDKHLADMAINAGANLKLNHTFEGIRKGQPVINKKRIVTEKLIGADGPLSPVAKSFDIYGRRKFVIGTQARIKLKVDPSVVEFWLGFGQFAWLVPESDSIARVGLIARSRPNQELKQLLKTRAPRSNIIDYQAGPIPIYNPKQQIQKKNIALLGDAATQVKATTYGGIIPGLIAAQELSKDFKNYQKNYKKRFGKELWSALMIRKILNKFKDQDYNKLIELFRKEKVKEIIETHDRDFPTRFLLKLLIREPRLLKFSKKFII